MISYAGHLAQSAELFDAELTKLLPASDLENGTNAPRLVQAMHHGVLNGGKRFRPHLTMLTAQLFCDEPIPALLPGLAVELVHCYSLIHDDLPAMDDDDLRRGKPTVHIAFDEATAILAGDTLLTLAFEILASDQCHADPATRMRLITELAKGSGADGMAGGQMLDLEGETRDLDTEEIAQMQAMKTGALIVAAVRMGAIWAGASDEHLTALTSYARHTGLAFQLSDDILDITSNANAMGKATKKDENANKQTLVSKIGLKAAQTHLGDTIHNALSALLMFDERADLLRCAAKFMATRES